MQNGHMDKPIKKKKITFARFTIRTLAISSSTLALFDFLKGDYQAGGLLVLGWLTIVIGEKRSLIGKKQMKKPKKIANC